MISKSSKQLSIAIGATALAFLIMFCVELWVTSEDSKEYKAPEARTDTLEYKQHFYSKSPQDGLMEALLYYKIKYPHIVYTQAVLETGHFKSDLCINNNNLFGLYNSRTKKYHVFNHWTESVVAYRDFIQKRYNSSEDYYEFLSRIGYAQDPEYIDKVKKIIKQNDKGGNK